MKIHEYGHSSYEEEYMMNSSKLLRKHLKHFSYELFSLFQLILAYVNAIMIGKLTVNLL